MTIRDLFRLLIKLFGLYSLMLTLFTFFPREMSSVYFAGAGLDIVLVFVLLLFFIVGLYLLLLHKTDWIINVLNLDKGFDEDKVLINGVTNKDVLKISIFLIGGFLIVDNISSFLSHTFFEFKRNLNSYDFIEANEGNYFNWLTNAISIVIGLVFIANYKSLANYLDKK